MSAADLLREAAEEGLEANLRRFLRFLDTRYPVELQVLGFPDKYARQQFAHALNEDEAVRLAAEADKGTSKGTRAEGVYVIFNTIDEAVATRKPANEWHVAEEKKSTTDRDIRCRNALFVDGDIERPAGTSTTDDELAHAHERTAEIADYLATLTGKGEAIGIGHSGNCGTALVALDHLEATPELDTAIQSILQSLDVIFSEAGGPAARAFKVDPVVHDRKRLCPCFGTRKSKGVAGNEKHPHRRTSFLSFDDVQRLSLDDVFALRDQLAEIAKSHAPPAKERTKGKGKGTSAFDMARGADVRKILDRYAIAYDEKMADCPGCGLTKEAKLCTPKGSDVPTATRCLHTRCVAHGPPGHGGLLDQISIVALREKVPPFDAAKLICKWLDLKETKVNSGSGEIHWMGADEIFAEDIPDENFLVEELDIAPGRPQVWAGAAFTAKTTTACEFALSVALYDAESTGVWAGLEDAKLDPKNLAWGMFPLKRGGVVKHIDAEMGSNPIRRKYRRLAQARYPTKTKEEIAALLKGRLHITSLPKFYLDQEDAEEQLMKICEGVCLVVIDSLRASVHLKSENDSEIREPLDLLNRVSDATGVVFVLLHHKRKTKPEDSKAHAVEGVRGSGAIIDAATSVLLFDGEKDAPKRVRHEKAGNTGVCHEDFYITITDVEIGGVKRAGIKVVASEKPDENNGPEGWDAKEADLYGQVVAVVAKHKIVKDKGVLRKLLKKTNETVKDAANMLIQRGVLELEGYKIKLSDRTVGQVTVTKARILDMLAKSPEATSPAGEPKPHPENGHATLGELQRWLAPEQLDVYVHAAAEAATAGGELEEFQVPDRGVRLRGWKAEAAAEPDPPTPEPPPTSEPPASTRKTRWAERRKGRKQ